MGATAHSVGFEPLGLWIEPFRVLGPLPQAQKPVQGRLAQVQPEEFLSELQQPGSTALQQVVARLA